MSVTTQAKEAHTKKGAENGQQVKESVKPKQEAFTKKLPTDFTVQERISRLEHLRILVQKYSSVKEKENELKTYLIEADGSQEFVIFCSGNDEKMRITNTNILKKMVKVLQAEMKTYRESVENEILSFTFEGED